MKKKRLAYNLFQKITAVFLILTLAWLTVSTGFICASQKEIAKHQGKAASSDIPGTDGQEEESKPLPGSAEEKNPAPGSSLSEEFLHETHVNEHFFSIVQQHYTHENADAYIAFHGELHAPPPNEA
ncbi:MAG: hypothetical protein QM791_14690 [Ferruginibacter sp.]